MVYIRALIAVVIVGGLIAWGFVVWKDRSFNAAAETRLEAMDQMEQKGVPEIQAETLGGEKVLLADLKGKIVILNFWASWCAPCIEEFPSMLKITKEFNGDVVLVAASQDGQRADIDAFLKSFPEANSDLVKVVWDEKKEIAKTYNVDRLPESFLIGPDGKLVTKIVGTINWYSDESIAYLREILKKK